MNSHMDQEAAMKMSNEQAIQILKPLRDMMIDQNGCPISEAVFALDKALEALSAQQWIPIIWHDCTDEDREKYGFSNDIEAVFDCEMPSDEQEILITTSHGYVCQDVCYIDDGFSLESGYDWIEDIIAWMPLPEPYEEESHE